MTPPPLTHLTETLNLYPTSPVSAAVVIDQLIAANAISFDSPLTSDGGQQTINWTFDPQAADLDWLKEGDKLELTWTAQIDDGHGIQGNDALTITIGGTNDLPTIDASTNPVPIGEQLGDSSAQDIAPTTGTIQFTDQDLGDSITLSVTGDATAAYTPDGNPQPLPDLPVSAAVVIDQLIAANAISFDSPLTSDGGQQTINWTFDPQAADLDWLKEGDKLELTWTAQIDDGHGIQGAHALTITIGGTNDLPTIDASTNPVPIGEQLGDSSAQDIAPTTGTIKFTDQDLGDSITLSVTGDATAAYTPDGNPQPLPDLPVSAAVVIDQLIAANAISFDSPLTSDGGQQTIDWTFDPQAADLDWLKEGDTLELTWTAQIDDGHGHPRALNSSPSPSVAPTTSPPSMPAPTRSTSLNSLTTAPHKTSLPRREPSPSPIKTSVTPSPSPSWVTPPPHTSRQPSTDPKRPAAVVIDQLIAANAISFADAGLPPMADNNHRLDLQSTSRRSRLAERRRHPHSRGPLKSTTAIQGAEQLTITIGGTNDIPTIDASTNPLDIAELG